MNTDVNVTRTVYNDIIHSNGCNDEILSTFLINNTGQKLKSEKSVLLIAILQNSPSEVTGLMKHFKTFKTNIFKKYEFQNL
ncbi:hypothetical protein T12_5380 [Trichinella patagoniensis]|uniref:Uncharacterized protein n=1 Tax=Trichinella patagoniensis TaxID=990121 RepID=A0A0V1AGB9_9BILA|nr:hypothetical protein T12_5380 [Trichinella patagoniensis]